MVSLAIDTSTSVCAAAIYDSGKDTIMAEITEDMERGHAERLMAVIGEVMQSAHCDYGDIRRVVCTVGPGSFTGIRVGLATARGIGLGLGVPVIGVTVLESLFYLANRFGNQPVLVAMDAKRGEAYYQMFSGLKDVPTDASVGTYEHVGAIAQKYPVALCGSGISKLPEQARQGREIIHEAHMAPIALIARIGASKEDTMSRPEPLYLRAPDAKPQSGFAITRR